MSKPPLELAEIMAKALDDLRDKDDRFATGQMFLLVQLPADDGCHTLAAATDDVDLGLIQDVVSRYESEYPRVTH